MMHEKPRFNKLEDELWRAKNHLADIGVEVEVIRDFLEDSGYRRMLKRVERILEYLATAEEALDNLHNLLIQHFFEKGETAGGEEHG